MDGADATVRKLRGQQAAIAQFGSFALRESDLLKVLTEAARACAEAIGVPLCKVCRYRSAENDLLIVAGYGWDAGVVGHVVSAADASSPQGRAFITGEPSICRDLRQDDAFQLPSFYEKHGIVSTIDVLVKGSGQPYGVLEIDNNEPHDYDQYDIDFLTAFANVLAEAVVTSERAATLQTTMGALAKSGQRLRNVIEAAPNAIAMTNADGRIEMVNAQAERAFGYARSELLGQKVDMLVPERFRGQYNAALSEFFKAWRLHLADVGLDTFCVRNGGQEFQAEVGLNLIESEEGPLVLSTIVDVTERVRLETQLRQAQKMEAIGRLTAGVAHDFNNLLQTLMGGLEMLIVGIDDRPSTLEYAETALKAARRGGRLTHRLLSFSRQQMLRPGKVPVRELLREAEALISHTFGPNIDFTVSPISDDLLVLADAGELQAAIINLAVNGRDALVDRGGHLRVSAHVAEPNASMTLAPGSYVVIVVEDSGPGMNETTIAQACDPFFTTKGPAESGLGLSMVQGFTRQSGGDLRIESAVGRGTRVEIWLPSANPTEVVGPSNTPMQEAFGGRILVVDDAPDVLVTVGAFLRHAGFAVTSVNSGDEAMAKLLSGDRFDAMVTDYAMHGLNGIDLLQQAREIDEAMPGLVISGFYGADSARSIDESLFLHKPFSRADLVERVRTMITRRRETAASAPSIAHRPA